MSTIEYRYGISQVKCYKRTPIEGASIDPNKTFKEKKEAIAWIKKQSPDPKGQFIVVDYGPMRKDGSYQDHGKIVYVDDR